MNVDDEDEDLKMRSFFGLPCIASWTIRYAAKSRYEGGGFEEETLDPEEEVIGEEAFSV